MNNDYLSIKTKTFWILLIIILLTITASFAVGYLYRGQADHAPIIIETSDKFLPLEGGD